ncbi:MAG TPA: xylan 1,4-beta-xylosidase [Micromonosporaceae bacterium]|nr:xylan 1,4-beta-xylosidase [Micromonosporaceae bacterium]
MTSPDARTDFETRIYQRLTDTVGADEDTRLPAPTDLIAEPAMGHVRLSWEPVAGAAGYVIERSEAGSSPIIVDHGGSDVPAVPQTVFADTGLRDVTTYTYRVGAVIGADYPVWTWSQPVSVDTWHGRTDGSVETPVVAVSVDASRVVGDLRRVWELIGSERLSQLLLVGDQKWIADEFATALRRVHEDLGVQRVRAHAILHDDNDVVRVADDGTVTYNFDRVDAIYDQLLDIGIRPVVELSFMPAALARDPRETVFTYGGIISPPADWSAWRALIAALAEHLIDRYGIDEVARWSFEVWNEPNLVVFWTGTIDEYLRLYEESARALKSVDARLAVGGPSTAAAEWVERLAAYAEHTAVPLDFVTSHTYGNLPLDVRPALARHGFEGTPVWWTEWGVGSTHFGPIHDTAFGAPFVLSGYAVAQHHLDALAYWVASDHFEELGRPDRLFHNGFGLLTVGNLAKPRYWAAHLAAHQGDAVLAHTVAGDGAAVLVQCSATRHDDGTIDVLTWNGTINAAVMSGDPRLDRNVRLEVGGLDPAIAYEATLSRIDTNHSNIAAACPTDIIWPDEQLWSRLRAADTLASEPILPTGPAPSTPPAPTSLPTPAGPPTSATASPAGDTTLRFDFALPMPGVARIRLRPARSAPRTPQQRPSNQPD